MVTEPYLISADQFLAMEFGPDERVELDNGVIRMMGGGTAAHARIQANLVAELRDKLKGSGCRPYGSDMAVCTRDMSVRYPDVSVYCDVENSPERDREKAFTNPVVVIEVLSPSTSDHDQQVKLAEYHDLPSVDTILFVDPDAERVRVLQRTSAEGWSDNWLVTGSDVPLPSRGITLTHAEIFARD